jgi:hypothetical protein
MVGASFRERRQVEEIDSSLQLVGDEKSAPAGWRGFALREGAPSARAARSRLETGGAGARQYYHGYTTYMPIPVITNANFKNYYKPGVTVQDTCWADPPTGASCGASKTSARKPMTSSRRSMAGSARASIRLI